MQYQKLIDEFVAMTQKIIGEQLTGIYLHGSMAMGCFHAEKSDIDILIVVNDSVTAQQKTDFMRQVVKLNEQAPAKGLEVSIVKHCYCRPFVYPTPFELHFSPAHLQWFHENPDDYIQKMNGVDKDLAAHFTIINNYGIVLSGEAIADVFDTVPKKDYMDSIWFDIENAEEDILKDPVYIILNLCRVMAFAKDGLCLSKAKGGEWGLAHLSEKYHALIRQALDCYQSNQNMQPDKFTAEEFAREILAECNRPVE